MWRLTLRLFHCLDKPQDTSPVAWISNPPDSLFLPEKLSAKNLFNRETKEVLGISALIFLALIVFSSYFLPPITIARSLSALGIIFYISIILFRFTLFMFSLAELKKNELDITRMAYQVSEASLPVYSVLIPLRHEKESLPGLINSLEKINWPKEKLDIKLIVDGDDEITKNAIADINLPPQIKVFIAPKAQPRSKPRVLNLALQQTNGEFLVIYDAEDRPEKNQLKRAHLTFLKSSSDTVCLQARLDYYNESQNLLTRWFAAEYAVWFDYVLPALSYFNLPMPLGGTSNHFRADFLKKIGGWDPYNVTEDCDLGMRIYSRGGKIKTMYGRKRQKPNSSSVAMLQSKTYEEASAHLGNWIRQRSRWNKGYLATFLVHLRYPLSAIQKFGFWGLVTFVFCTFGTIFINLTNLFFYALFFCWLFFDPPQVAVFFPPHLLKAHQIIFFLGNGFFIAMHVVAPLMEKRRATAFLALGMPIYWLLMIIPTFKAIWQLIIKPDYWEKTKHFGTMDIAQGAGNSTMPKGGGHE